MIGRAATLMGRTLNQQMLKCDLCPRLRRHCLDVAETKRAAFRDQTYHGLPVPNFGRASARLLIVGLAPAAHGANRTGRMFTGDRSGDFLYRAMHEAGFANQPTATHARDGLSLVDAMITATVHCAPPANKPAPAEVSNCRPFLERTFTSLMNLRSVLCLGQIAFGEVLKHYRTERWVRRAADHPFAHGALYRIDGAPALLCSYHPSQQNTFTGRLTHEMLLAVFRAAREVVGGC